MPDLALRLLRLRPWQRHAVFEVAIDGPGQMEAYGPMLRPDLTVVTTIGSEHHRSLGTLDVTQAEKGRMVEALGPKGIAVLNQDDPRVAAMAGLCAGRVITYGLSDEADVRATEVAIDWPHGTRLLLHVAGRTMPVRLRLLGRVMVYPFLAAVAVAHAEGVPLERAVAALEAMPPRRGRLQLEPLPNGAWLVRDDFKSSVETIDAALDVLAELPGRRIVVIGSVSEPPGSQGPIYRRLGERLAEMATQVIVVSSEFQRYAAGARAGRHAPLRPGRCAPRRPCGVGGGAGRPPARRRRSGQGARYGAPGSRGPGPSGSGRALRDRFLRSTRHTVRGLPEARDRLGLAVSCQRTRLSTSRLL